MAVRAEKVPPTFSALWVMAEVPVPAVRAVPVVWAVPVARVVPAVRAV